MGLLGHEEHRRNKAETLLAGTSSNLVRTSRAVFAPAGFLGAVATARRQPLVVTLSRALQTSAARRWPRRSPKVVAAALAACAEPATATPANIIEAVTALCAQQPLLLVMSRAPAQHRPSQPVVWSTSWASGAFFFAARSLSVRRVWTPRSILMSERREPAATSTAGWSAGQLVAAAYRIAEHHLTASEEGR